MCNSANFQKDFKSVIDLITYFNSEEKCSEYLAQARWGENPSCVHCGNDHVYTLKGKTKRFKCAGCRKQFSVRVGTIFEDSKLPLQKWFLAIYLITSHSKGISSVQLAKDLGVTQKTAWFINHRIRETFSVETPEASGEVEIDETYVGGKEKNKHKSKRTKGSQGRSTKTKEAVLGILDREQKKVIVQHVKDTRKASIVPIMRNVVASGSSVYTDTYKAYKGLSSDYDHQTVNHSADEYVRGNVHTNTIEGFWSLFKRGIIGIYHFTSSKHLAKYLDEFAFRYNSRNLTESDRFRLMLLGCEKRLSYNQLIKSV